MIHKFVKFISFCYLCPKSDEFAAMFVSEISLWGAAIVACVVLMAMIALAFFDRQMLRRMLVIFGATVAQMAVVVAVVWLVYQTNAWWAYLLWFLLVLALSICWCLFPLQSLWKKMLRPVSVAMLVGSIVVGGGRQCDADAAHQRLPVNLFGADGLYDGFAHADHDEIPAQPAKARSAARGYASSDKESGSALGDGRADALCRYAVGRCRCPRRAARHAAADSCLLRGQYIGGRDSIGDDQGEEQGVTPQRMNTDLT